MNSENVPVRSLMLKIARNAIDSRADMDGYPSGEYDATHDPEGYITSLLNALSQWCYVHGIDWENELIQAQGFFEQDMADLPRPSEPASKPAIEDMKCPSCGEKDAFVVEVSERLLMFPGGVALHGDNDEEWGDWSYCRCHHCQYAATLRLFLAEESRSEGRAHG